MSTVHNKAENGQIAKTVLMPGDPLRAKHVAESFLTDVKLVNDVRCAYAFTGKYKGKEVSVMASGMGTGSMGIYSHELFAHYDVQNIIRIGSAGALSTKLHLGDILVALSASTDSGYANHLEIKGNFSPCVSETLLRRCFEKDKEKKVRFGNILTSEVFYTSDEYMDKWRKLGVLAAEMETYALYVNAAKLGKDALSMFTISDIVGTEQSMSSLERQTGFNKMIEYALEVAL